MGGEEFAVVLPGVTKDDTIKIAEDIRIATETLKIEHEGNNFAFTASIGIAAVKGETTIEPALDRADAALYDAKTSGRNQIKAA
jgi:diguanylate cyclase (GGDEF)-like protein